MNNNLTRYIELCNQDKTRKEIAEELEVTPRSVSNYLKSTGIVPKSDKRKAKLNENYFSVINTEEKAYILGFIYADGYIETNERTLTFNISEVDLDIIYKIKKELKCENEIRKSSTKNCVRLYLSSIKLVADLKQVGVTRCKSLTIGFPKLRDDLIRHFIRGFFDGDGHIGNRQCALVIGSAKFLDGFDSIIFDKFGKKLYRNDMNNYCRVQFNRRDSDIIKWMYENSNIYLDRKYKKYIDCWENYKIQS